MVKNNTTRTSKNSSSLRTSAWVINLIIQLVALSFIGIGALSFGVIGLVVLSLLAVGYALLVMRTIQFIKDKITGEDSISALIAIHLVAFIVSGVVIAIFLAFYYGTKF